MNPSSGSDPSRVHPLTQQLLDNLGRVVVGKRRELELVLTGLLAQGHLLIEDVPGVGKTMLARALAQSLGCTFSRIQFTPDLLPSDITGTSVFNPRSREFEFRPGPLMAQIVLADEINRATPKTQSALLEAMEERQITIDGIAHPLPRPFLVIGTQNPIEYEGTFPLPEGQLDRFLLRVRLGYLSKAEEVEMAERQQFEHPLASLPAIISESQLEAAQEAVKNVHLSPSVKRYIVDLIFATRDLEGVYLGSSPRGTLGLFAGSQALAAIRGRDYVLPDDVKSLAEPVLAHRIILDPAARMRASSPQQVIARLLDQVPLPDSDSPA
jgi:MoxR-like ATPase